MMMFLTYGCRFLPWLLLSSLVLAVAATTTSASPLREKPPYVPEAEIHSRNFLQESRSAVGSPLDVEPFHYDLYIQPSIEEGTFTGFVNISFTALLKVSHLEINALGLKVYDEQIIDTKKGSLIPIDTKYEFKPGESIVYITNMVLPRNKTLMFSAKFSGTLLDTDLGFYRSYYLDSESSEKRWYAETQFQATNARRAFPCFDDPQFRPTFVVNIRHNSTLNASSNTKLESVSEPDERGIVWSRFEKTPPMPTYLVAFAVNDFVSTSGMTKIWVRKDALAQVKEAQELTPIFVTILEQWTDQLYALSKLDQIASPGHHGAMENWGLIIYKERILTGHPNATTLDTITSRLTLAHELAHQWFGNLVTLKSWNTVWLSEGFANFMQYLVVEKVKKEWALWGLFPLREMNKAFSLDETYDVKPITQNVVTAEEILANFNRLSYTKGACILRMLQHALGESTFQRGVQKYLQVMRMGNAVPEDLSRELAYYADADDVLPFGVVLERVLHSWTLQGGYPVVNVTRDKAGKSVTLAQDRYCINCPENSKGSWWIPVSVSTQRTYANKSTRPAAWLAPDEGAFLEDVDKSAWIIANRDRTGYFRVNYDPENWNQLVKQLMSSPTDLSETDIAMLIDDAGALAFTGRLQPDILIRLLSYLPLESRIQPWLAATYVILERFTPKFGLVKDGNNLIYQKWLQQVVESAYENLGAAKKPDDSDAERILRLSLLQLAREADLELYNWDTQDGNEPDSDNEEAYLCSKIKFGPKKAFNEAVARVMNLDVDDDLQRIKIIRSLACTQDVAAVRLLLTYSVTESGLTDNEKTELWNSALRSRNGTNLALDILKANHDNIMARYGDKFVGSRLLSLARYLDREHDYNSLQDYIELYVGPATTIGRQTAQALKTVLRNIKWKTENLKKWVSLIKKAKVPVPQPPTKPRPEYRLPENLVPVHYDLKLHPSLENFTFQGDVVLTAVIKNETDTIVLHSVNLTVTSTKVTDAKTGKDIAVGSVKTDPMRQFLLIPLIQALPPETEVKISISFNGILSDNNLGFYRSSYEENDQIKWVAATQFEPTHARRAFPCLDEPGFRATFNITVMRQRHLKVLGNMPVQVSSKPDENGLVTDTFEQTPNMATYLVALVVSEFRPIPISNGPPTMTVWARPNITEALVAEKVSAALLGNMSISFGVPQPVPKYDFVALPDLYFGAMENWGLVTFREYLLVNNASVGTAIQQKIALIIAHELAHQWFGNLLTVKWWSTLWQQEGMATFMSYIAVDKIQGTSTAIDRLRTKEFTLAMEADSTELSSPLNFEVYKPEEITARSDDITYAKGSIVLNMLYSVMGVDNFGAGISEYVRQNLYGNVDTNSLASALAQAQGDLGDGLTPSELISSWADQAGYPVIDAFQNYDDNSFNITQEGKRVLKYTSLRRLPDQRWTIPIFVATPNFKGNVSAVLRPSDAEKIVKVTSPGIAMVNAHREVPMRVNYDVRKWLLIASTMQTNLRTVLDPITRATLFDDAFWFARTKRLDYTIALNLLLGYKYEDSALVWESSRQTLRHLEAILRNSEVQEDFSDYLAEEIVGVQYSSLGWNHGPNDSDELRLRRALIASWACSLYVEACVSSAFADYRSWLSKKEVSRDTLPTAICTGLAVNGAQDFVTVVAMLFETRKEDQELRAAIISGLGCVSTERERKRFIMDVLTLNGYQSSDVNLAIDSVMRNGYLDDVIDAFTSNLEQISSSLGSSGVESLLLSIAEQTATYDLEEKIKAAFPNKRASDKVKIALRIAEDNVQYRDSVSTIVTAWVKSQVGRDGPALKL